MTVKTYKPDLPCKHGHFERYVSNHDCAVCASKYREKNRAREITRALAWRAANPERDRASRARHYSANRDAILAKQATAYAADPSKKTTRQARQTIYAAEHKEQRRAYYSAWKKANPEIRRALERNRKALKRASVGAHTAAEIKTLFRKQRGRCAYFKICGNSIRTAYHADHIVSLAKGGSNGIGNIQLTCPSCNCRKKAKDPLVFARQIGLLI